MQQLGAVVVLLGISAAVLHSRSVSEPERAAKATASQASETSPVLLTVNGISLEGLSKMRLFPGSVSLFPGI